MEPSETDIGKVRSLRPTSDASRERLLWTRFREARDAETFRRSWLALQCHLIEGVDAGLLVMAETPGGSFDPVATWPEGRPAGRHLVTAAQRVLQDKRALALKLEPQGEGAKKAVARTVLAQPIEISGELVGAVAIEVTPRAEAVLETDLRRLTWGAAWLPLHDLQAAETRGEAERLEALLELIAAPLDHTQFRAAASAFVNALAAHFHCERVSLGFARKEYVKVEAVSHSAAFGKRANVTRAIETAMDEALGQQKPVVWPLREGAPPQVTRDHDELARVSEAGAICSVPAAHGGEFCSVFTLERGADAPFSEADLELIETAVSFAGPMLDVQHVESRWIGAKLVESFRNWLDQLVGPRHVGLKLGVGFAVSLFAFLAVAKGDFRVTSDMVLEARVLRAASAPFDGYIEEAPVRAGDLVKKGELLVMLDGRELTLERSRWFGELEQLLKQQRQALGERDAPQVAILTAKVDQVRAQLRLVEDRLAKTRLIAPFDGVVVTGDLSQKLGASVRRGDVLFEVAPLDEYRVVLQVDERDIDEVAVGQTGELVFAAFPDESYAFEVEKLTPVAVASEGVNAFRVEGNLAEAPPRLRPGMEGVGKVEVDRRRLLWIWTHEAVDWLRLAAWNWLP